MVQVFFSSVTKMLEVIMKHITGYYSYSFCYIETNVCSPLGAVRCGPVHMSNCFRDIFQNPSWQTRQSMKSWLSEKKMFSAEIWSAVEILTIFHTNFSFHSQNWFWKTKQIISYKVTTKQEKKFQPYYLGFIWFSS